MLNYGTPPNIHLQRAWNLHGADSFELNLLYEVERDFQIIEEQKLLDSIRDSGEELYNIALFAGAPNKGRKASPELRAKLTERNRKRYADNPELKSQISSKMKEHLNDSTVRTKMSASRAEEAKRESTKSKRSASMTEYYSDKENRKRMSEKLLQFHTNKRDMADNESMNNQRN